VPLLSVSTEAVKSLTRSGLGCSPTASNARLSLLASISPFPLLSNSLKVRFKSWISFGVNFCRYSDGTRYDMMETIEKLRNGLTLRKKPVLEIFFSYWLFIIKASKKTSAMLHCIYYSRVRTATTQKINMMGNCVKLHSTNVVKNIVHVSSLERMCKDGIDIRISFFTTAPHCSQIEIRFSLSNVGRFFRNSPYRIGEKHLFKYDTGV
jgi:hypothetical protein